jgi:hypothetical protein
MASDSKIFICEFVIPPTGLAPNTAFRLLSALDMQMMVACASKERTVEDWHALVKLASPKLKLKQFHMTPGAPLAIIEIVLDQ